MDVPEFAGEEREAHRAILGRFWQTANARDWGAFAALLHPELFYVVPQTRERVRGRDGFVDFFQTWPGDWEAQVETLIADGRQGVTVIAFASESEKATGISFFEFADGLIHRITEYWPEPYEPPRRFSAFVERSE